jgi:DNA polymerase-3 subunit beta
VASFSIFHRSYNNYSIYVYNNNESYAKWGRGELYLKKIMRVEVDRMVLKKALGAAMRVVAVKVQLPMLANVLLESEKGRLKVGAANLEMGMEVGLGVKVEKEGKVAVPARVLAELVGNLAGEKVKLEGEGMKLRVESDGGKVEVMGMDPGEFPGMAGFPKEVVLTLERGEFLEAMREVGFAAATDESRPVLATVLVKQGGTGGVEMVATDGFRLSRKTIGTADSSGKKADGGGKKGKADKGERQWLIPVKAMMEVGRLVEEESEEVRVEMGEVAGKNQVVFRVGEVLLSSRLVEGEFPDYEKIMPGSWGSRMAVEREELSRNLKMVGVFARESANVVKFRLGKTGVKLAAESAALGKGEGLVEGKLEGEELEVAFNFRYVLDYLNAAASLTKGGGEVVLELSGSLTPGVWKVEGEEGWTHVVMPVRLQEEGK